MGLGALREGQLVRWRQRMLKLEGRLPDGSWQLTELTTGLRDEQSEDIMLRAIETGELVFVCEEDEMPGEVTKRLLITLPGNATFGSIEKPGGMAERNADHRWMYVKAIAGISRDQARDSIRRAWEKLKWPTQQPGYSTVCSWRKKTEGKSDPIGALRERDKNKGRRGDRYGKEEMDIMRDVRDLHYLKKSPRIKMARALEIVRDTIVLENDSRPRSDHLQIPKRRAFQKVVDEIPKKEQIARRFGADAAMKAMRTSQGGVETTRPLQRVEIDHTPLSIFLLDEDFMPWGRANATLAQDAHTTYPVGTYWGAEVPSIVSLARCIRHSVLPKNEFLSKYPNVKGNWDAYGLAERYVADNGFEEHAAGLRQACSQMGGAIVELCPRAAPWFKPNVERFFRTGDLDLLQTLPGATMENIMTRSDFDPKKDMLLRRSTFDRIYIKWIVDVFARERKASLSNLSPAEAWHRDIGLSDLFIPTKTILLERLFLRDVDDRCLDHEGIEYDCLIYNSAEMGALRSQLGAKLSVRIRVSDEDLGHIFVCVPGHDVWIRVSCLDQKYARGLTRWQHDKCKKMRRLLLDEGYEVTLAASRAEILAEIAAEADEFRQAFRKKRSRFKESSAKAPEQMESLMPSEAIDDQATEDATDQAEGPREVLSLDVMVLD